MYFCLLFYMVSLLLFLYSSNSEGLDWLYWLFFEVNLLSFIWLVYYLENGLFFFGSSILFEGSKIYIYYFFFQSLGSILILFSSYLNLNISLMFYTLFFSLGILIKMGLFPFHFWGFTWSSMVTLMVLSFLFTLQKFPFFLFLLELSDLMFFFVVLNLVVGSYFLFNSCKFKYFLYASSLNSTFWFFCSICYSFFLFTLILMHYFLSFFFLSLNMMTFSFYRSSKMFLFCLFWFISGLPPFSFFFLKYQILDLFFSLSWSSLFFLFSFSYLALMCYFKFFYFAMISLNFTYYYMSMFKYSYLFFFFLFVHILFYF